MREQLEEEQEGRSDLQRMLTKANNEMAVWRHKCESGEGGVRSEEMEELKRKMNAKIMELETALEAAQSKANSMEKVKNRLQGELEDLTIEVERVRKIILYSYHRYNHWSPVKNPSIAYSLYKENDVSTESFANISWRVLSQKLAKLV